MVRAAILAGRLAKYRGYTSRQQIPCGNDNKKNKSKQHTLDNGIACRYSRRNQRHFIDKQVT
jgi:hypothetical protein